MRALLCLGLCFLGAACGPEEAGETDPAPRAPRHVLLVTIDTLRPDRLGCYGGERQLSPRIDQLARDGVRFQRALAPIPQTSPSHASLFTGRYPLDHGLTSNMNRIGEDVVTLAEVLRDHGFATGAFYNVFPFHQARLTQGFDRRTYDETEDAALIDEKFLAFVDAHPDEPLFLWVHLFLPHSPLDPPEEFRHLVEHPYDGPLDHGFGVLHAIRRGQLKPGLEFFDNYRDLYDAEVAHTDQRFGRLLDALDTRDLLDETLVVFAADHGEVLEDGLVGLHAPYLRETTLHVPLILRAPNLPRDTVVEETVELLDVFATVLELMDLPVPVPVASRSLEPLCRGDSTDWDGLAFATLPSEYLGRVDAQHGDAAAAAVARGPKLFVRDTEGERSLYDLDRPAGQRRRPPDEVELLAAQLEEVLDQWVRDVRSGRTGESLDEDTRRLLQNLGYEEGEDPLGDSEESQDPSPDDEEPR